NDAIFGGLSCRGQFFASAAAWVHVPVLNGTAVSLYKLHFTQVWEITGDSSTSTSTSM
ncbi:hypothetical protein ACJX0J_005758, partial [Zea mays]